MSNEEIKKKLSGHNWTYIPSKVRPGKY